MLNGIAPIMIFNFSKLLPDLQESVASIPVLKSFVDKVGLPPIPVYLSQELTGLMIDSESKSIDIETSAETLADGKTPQVAQKGVNSSITIQMQADKGSIGLTLLSALMDQVFQKVSSKEYSITYLNGAVTIFNGLLHSFSIDQNANTSLYSISLTLSNAAAKPGKPEETPKGDPPLEKISGPVPVNGGPPVSS